MGGEANKEGFLNVYVGGFIIGLNLSNF